MPGFQKSISINAPIERVWSVLADVTRWYEWTASITRIDPLDGAELKIGARYRIYQPKLNPAVWTVTELQSSSRFVWVSKNPGVIVVAEHALIPTAMGCTFEQKLQFDGWLGAIFGFLNRELTQRYLGLEAAGLKARSEGKK